MNYNYNYPPNSHDAVAGAAGAGALAGLLVGFIIFMVFFAVAMYVYYAICLMKIAKKTGTSNGFLAWIPIANIVLILMIAKKPIWWIIMFFIPLVNVVFGIIVWMAIAEAVKKPGWWGVMVIVPVMNIIMPGYLAFSKMDGTSNVSASPVQPAV